MDPCTCGSPRLKGLKSCAECSWGASDDETEVVVAKLTATTITSKTEPAPPAKHVVPLSCFKTCKDCQFRFRGATCPECTPTKSQLSTSKSTSFANAKHPCANCNAMIANGRFCADCRANYRQTNSAQKQCEECKASITDGRFCKDCRLRYQAAFQNVCQDCKKTRIPDDWRFCKPCMLRFKTSRTCKNCPNATRRGVYCDECFVALKTQT